MSDDEGCFACGAVRLEPFGTYTIQAAHEKELERMRERLRAAEKRELEALAELDEERENVRTLKTHVETLREAWQGASEAAVKLGDKLDQAERELDEAKAAIRLVLEADCLKSHAFERGDDDASVYDLLKSVVSKP